MAPHARSIDLKHLAFRSIVNVQRCCLRQPWPKSQPLDSPWPSDKTYLATLDVEPHRVRGLDPTLQPFNDSSDLGDDRAVVFLKRSCARLLRWIHVGSDDITSISDIHTDAQVAERAYKEADDIIGFLGLHSLQT